MAGIPRIPACSETPLSPPCLWTPLPSQLLFPSLDPTVLRKWNETPCPDPIALGLMLCPGLCLPCVLVPVLFDPGNGFSIFPSFLLLCLSPNPDYFFSALSHKCFACSNSKLKTQTLAGCVDTHLESKHLSGRQKNRF